MDSKLRVSLETFIENHDKLLFTETVLLSCIHFLREKYDYCLIIKLKRIHFYSL